MATPKDNSAALRQGTQKALALIRENIAVRLSNLMYDAVDDLEMRIKESVAGMTGNTWTSPAGAVYVNGVMEDLVLGADALQGKLLAGQVFSAGRERYDGDIQEHPFKATIDTTGRQSRIDKYEFLESQQSGKGFKMTITGGTEYAGEVALTDNYTYVQQQADKYLK